MTGDESNLVLAIDSPNWKELYDFAHEMKYGSVQVTFKEGVPVRIDNPMQSLVFGIVKLK